MKKNNSQLPELKKATSGFSDVMEEEQGFVLRTPLPEDSDYVKCNVYFFNTPNKITIEVSSGERVGNVCRHILTLYLHNEMAKRLPELKNPNDWKAFELRLVDDFESEYSPDMDIPALCDNDQFGRVGQSLAFIEKKQSRKEKAYVPRATTEDLL